MELPIEVKAARTISRHKRPRRWMRLSSFRAFPKNREIVSNRHKSKICCPSLRRSNLSSRASQADLAVIAKPIEDSTSVRLAWDEERLQRPLGLPKRDEIFRDYKYQACDWRRHGVVWMRRYEQFVGPLLRDCCAGEPCRLSRIEAPG